MELRHNDSITMARYIKSTFTRSNVNPNLDEFNDVNLNPHLKLVIAYYSPEMEGYDETEILSSKYRGKSLN